MSCQGAASAASAAAPVSPKVEALATVHQFVNGFNKGDGASALAACADQTSIIDEFPPYEWHGTGACARWAQEYESNAKREAITDGLVTLGNPFHVAIVADRGYVVVPANYTFKLKGRTTKEVGSIFAFSLQKLPAGWRITGWSYAKH
jgi:hypothetical protein